MGRAVVEADAGLVGKALPAEAADEGPLSPVDPVGVDLQRSGLGEAFPTLAAVVGLLPRVDPLVRADGRQVRERPAAEFAGVRPLAGVNAPVDLQRARLAEALAAVGAGVGPGARVHVLVDAEVAVRVERPAAFRAEESRRLVGVLGALVLQQLVGPGEGGRAVHAGVQGRRVPDGPPLLGLGTLVRFPGAFPGAGSDGVLATQAGQVGEEARAGQAGGQGAVVVVEVVVGVGERRVRALLEAQQLGAAVGAPSARTLPLLPDRDPGLGPGSPGDPWLGRGARGRGRGVARPQKLKG